MIQEPMTVAVEVQPPRYNLYCGARVMQGPSRWNVFYLSFVITALFIVYLALMYGPVDALYPAADSPLGRRRCGRWCRPHCR